jgi:hypothetical protein
MLVHASTRDVKQTIAAVEKLLPDRHLVQDCYFHEELGPILRGAAFRDFQKRFPEPPRNIVPIGDFLDDD